VLSQLRIRNIALIDELEIEFGEGFNLLTGETGSGKSIIVDSLVALTGERVSTDLIKQGESSARIEGVFEIGQDHPLGALLDESGVDSTDGELIVRRDLSRDGKNRIFVNDQLVTRSFLKKLGPALADIHGQGEQATLYDVASHVIMLDDFAAAEPQKGAVADAYRRWERVSDELASLKKDESEKLQLIDILGFQVNEIGSASLKPGEDTELETEKRRLANAEKLAALSTEAYSLLYEDENATLSTLDRGAKAITELAQFEDSLHEFDEGLATARAVIEEVAATARAYRSKLEISPERLNEIEDRLAEISRLKRKYGESINAVLAHLADAEQRLENIETADLREQELRKELADAEQAYLAAAANLHTLREKAAVRFSKAVESELRDVALDKAKFEVRFQTVDIFGPNGTDRVEFYFSANPGETVRPLAKVASGGEASRLMLVLKTVARPHEKGKTAVFDEVDVGIGGRVAEAVGRKLKALSSVSQVFCVTHQPQIASLADHHFVVEKRLSRGNTTIGVRELEPQQRIEELARMLAGEHVTDAARENARAMLTAAA
jgi:DNA repair protein RecN (Recombination protein N)